MTSHQHTAALPGIRGQEFPFIYSGAVIITGKEPFVPGRFLDKQGPCHKGYVKVNLFQGGRPGS